MLIFADDLESPEQRELDPKDGSSGSHYSKEMEQGLGRLGFAANALTRERLFLGPLYAWSAAIRSKKGLLRIPAMLRTIFWFLAERTRDGGSLQEPTPIRKEEEADLVFFTDAKATEQGAWIGGFLQSKDGSIISWFSEEVEESWTPWPFIRKGSETGHCSSGITGYVGSCQALGQWFTERWKGPVLGESRNR